MSEFEEFLKASASIVLRRELTERERVEYLELGAAIGHGNFKDYVHMIFAFKRCEDNITNKISRFNKTMESRFEAMTNLEKKIDDKLEATIKNILGKGAEEMAKSMGDKIALKAETALQQYEKYHFYKGQTVVITITGILMSIAYLLGTMKIFDYIPSLLTLPLYIPSGVLAFIGLLAYAALWWYGRVEHRSNIRPRSLFWDRTTLVVMALILICIVMSMIF